MQRKHLNTTKTFNNFIAALVSTNSANQAHFIKANNSRVVVIILQ